MKLALLVLVAALVLAPPARADDFDDNPATASRGGGDMWVFVRAADGAILERHWTAAGWTDWNSLGGNATSGPAAVGYGSSVLVFVRGPEGAIHQRTFNGTTWGSWVSLGGYATSAPAATVRRGPLGYVDLAVKGGDNAIWFQSYVPGRGWSGWVSRGGNLTSAPALNSQADGIVNLWARGTDGALYQQYWDGTAWSAWFSLGGGIVGAPSVVSRTENVVNVYVRGAGNATYQRSWTQAGSWGAWFLLDRAAVGSSPAAGADGPNHEWLFARNGGNLVLKNWNGPAGWTGWGDLGPAALPPPSPPPAPPAPAPAPPPNGSLGIETGLRCTPPGGLLRVKVRVRKPRGGQRARVARIVFFTRGKGRRVRVDRKAPWRVRLRINRPAGSKGRVYARVYYRRSKHGKLHRKTVSRRYVVCR
jgi:hypothetical protein